MKVNYVLILVVGLCFMSCTKSPPTQPYSYDPPLIDLPEPPPEPPNPPPDLPEPNLPIVIEHLDSSVYREFLLNAYPFLQTGQFNDPWVACLTDTTWRFVGSVVYVLIEGDPRTWVYTYDIAVVHQGNGNWTCLYMYVVKVSPWPPRGPIAWGPHYPSQAGSPSNKAFNFC